MRNKSSSSTSNPLTREYDEGLRVPRVSNKAKDIGIPQGKVNNVKESPLRAGIFSRKPSSGSGIGLNLIKHSQSKYLSSR